MPTLLSIKLVGGAVPWAGRVEISIEGTSRYGRLCGSGWGLGEATVACRQLGYPTAVGVSSRDVFGQGMS